MFLAVRLHGTRALASFPCVVTPPPLLISASLHIALAYVRSMCNSCAAAVKDDRSFVGLWLRPEFGLRPFLYIGQ